VSLKPEDKLHSSWQDHLNVQGCSVSCNLQGKNECCIDLSYGWLSHKSTETIVVPLAVLQSSRSKRDISSSSTS
jgi:hypothetical protein